MKLINIAEGFPENKAFSLETAKHFLKQNAGDNPTIDQLAQIAHIRPSILDNYCRTYNNLADLENVLKINDELFVIGSPGHGYSISRKVDKAVFTEAYIQEAHIKLL